MKWNYKNDIIPLLVFISLAVLSTLFYPVLPDTVPTHFNGEGTPDGFSTKMDLVLFNAGISVFLYMLLTFIPFIDPFWKKIEQKYTLFLVFRDIALIFSLFAFAVILYSARAGKLETGIYGMGFGGLFILMGNYLPKLPRNFFFGIRTPWTLASDVVWRKTHVLSGWLFVAAGLALILLAVLKVRTEVAMAVTLGPVVIFSAVLYPLFLYKKLQKNGNAKVPEL